MVILDDFSDVFDKKNFKIYNNIKLISYFP